MNLCERFIKKKLSRGKTWGGRRGGQLSKRSIYIILKGKAEIIIKAGHKVLVLPLWLLSFKSSLSSEVFLLDNRMLFG